jgi:hypothetical protein
LKVTQVLHHAFRARDPEKLAHFYAELFEGRFFLHPVMTGLGIIIVKLAHPEALFHGLLEFWPWDVVWDSEAALFRKVQPRPSAISCGHFAVKVPKTAAQIIAELKTRDIHYRMEPRGVGFFIPTIDDPEGNLIELFPNIDNIDVPAEAICEREAAGAVISALRRQFAERTAGHAPEKGYPLTF